MDKFYVYRYRGSFYLSTTKPSFEDCGMKRGWVIQDEELLGPAAAGALALVEVEWPTDETICFEYTKVADRPRVEKTAAFQGSSTP